MLASIPQPSAGSRWKISHVVGYQDPPNVERLAGKTLVAFLSSGEVDDAIVTTASLAEPTVQTCVV